MAPGRIVLELTERETIRDADRLRTTLVAIQNAGVRVAADDVGAGNAGLRLLSQFRFDVVKIDLSLVQRAGEDRTNSVLPIHRRRRRTDGRDDDRRGRRDTIRTARRLGITAGQGYLLGRPGIERDLTWVDIAALEQRDDVGIPITADLVDDRAPRRSVGGAGTARRSGQPAAPASRRGRPAQHGKRGGALAFLRAARLSSD